MNGHRCGAVPAGDFAGSPSDTAVIMGTKCSPGNTCRAKKVRYREAYANHLFRRIADPSKRPIIWAFHNWGDLHRFEVRDGIKRFNAPITKHFRRTYAKPKYRYGNGEGKTPSVWVTEVGAAYRHTCRQIRVTKDPRGYRNSESRCGPEPAEAKNPDGSYNRDGDKRALRYGELRQRNAAAFLFRIMTMSKKRTENLPLAPIQRLYYYNTEDNRGADVSAPGDNFHTGRCNTSKTCPILESGLIGSLVDDVPDSEQPNVIIRDFPRPSPDLSRTNRPRSAFCALRQHDVRPAKKNPSCNP